MRCHKILLACTCALLFTAWIPSSSAQEQARATAEPTAASTTADAEPIPFRRDAKSLPEQSISALVTTLLLLAAACGGLYYFRQHLQKLPRKNFLRASGIEIVERAHVSPKLSLYVVRYRGKEIMLAQSGNSIAQLAEFNPADLPSSLPGSPTDS